MQQFTNSFLNEPLLSSLLFLLAGAVVSFGLVIACGFMINRQVCRKINEVTSRPHLN